MTIALDQMTAGASDRYSDTDTHVSKKSAGRRPALTKTDRHEMTIAVNQMTAGASDRYTDTDPHVIEKELAEGQL